MPCLVRETGFACTSSESTASQNFFSPHSPSISTPPTSTRLCSPPPALSPLTYPTPPSTPSSTLSHSPLPQPSREKSQPPSEIKIPCTLLSHSSIGGFSNFTFLSTSCICFSVRFLFFPQISLPSLTIFCGPCCVGFPSSTGYPPPISKDPSSILDSGSRPNVLCTVLLF